MGLGEWSPRAYLAGCVHPGEAQRLARPAPGGRAHQLQLRPEALRRGVQQRQRAQARLFADAAAFTLAETPGTLAGCDRGQYRGASQRRSAALAGATRGRRREGPPPRESLRHVRHQPVGRVRVG